MPVTGAVEAFWETIDRAYGAFLDAATGFHFFREKIAELQQHTSSSLNIPTGELDSVSFIFGEGDPNTPNAVLLHTVSQGELKHRNRKNGENALFMGAMCLVAIYQFWEDRFRAEIAAELKLSRDALKHDLLGDIRLIRIGIVHHGGVAKPEIDRCKQLKWFKAGDVIEINDSRMKQVVFALRDVCRQWMIDRSAQPDAAPDRQSE